MAGLEIVTGVERRRRWSDKAKLQILAEADEPGARIGEVARRNDIYPAHIRSWRQSFSAPDNLPAFVPVNIVDSDAGGLSGRGRGAGAPTAQSSMIEIALLQRSFAESAGGYRPQDAGVADRVCGSGMIGPPGERQGVSGLRRDRHAPGHRRTVHAG